MMAKWKKIIGIVCIFAVNAALCGCYAWREPQNRNYVMCMGIDAAETGWKITYSFPDLAALTGTDTQPAEPVRSVEAATIQDASDKLNAASDKIADYSQLSVILVGDSVGFYGQKMEQLLQELTDEKAIKRTVMIGRVDGKAEDIVRLDDNVNGSIGVFLYELCQNNYEDRGYKLSVLEDFVGGRGQINCVIPVFEAQEEWPVLVQLDKLQ
ncbi:MAG: hypothetical protein ACI4BB_07620 [Coprococcus sp.]